MKTLIALLLLLFWLASELPGSYNMAPVVYNCTTDADCWEKYGPPD